MQHHAKASSQSLERLDRRIGGAVFEFADVGLGDAGHFRELLLGHASFLSCVDHRLGDGKLRLDRIPLSLELRVFKLFCQQLLKIMDDFFSFRLR